MLARSLLIAALGGLLAGAAAAQQPDAKTLVVAFGTDAQTLEPADINSRDTANIADHLWGSLYEIARQRGADALPGRTLLEVGGRQRDHLQARSPA